MVYWASWILEFGSPVLPKTVEAQILHQADKMSGDESILSFIKKILMMENHLQENSGIWNRVL